MNLYLEFIDSSGCDWLVMKSLYSELISMHWSYNLILIHDPDFDKMSSSESSVIQGLRQGGSGGGRKGEFLPLSNAPGTLQRDL